MAPRKLDASPRSAIAGARVAKRTNKKIRFSTNGPLGVERKSGEFLKLARQNQRESPLLKLPADLRNQDVSKAPENAFALLEVSHQIYAETALLRLSLVVFFTCSPGLLHKWLGGLLEAKFNVIGKLHLRLDLCLSPSPISAYHLLTLSKPMNDDVVGWDFTWLSALERIRVSFSVRSNASLGEGFCMKIINLKVSVTADWCDGKLIEEQSRNAITGIPLQKD
ncbi:hypothetical protein HBI25_120070 [Parastagonospora nodorum]|nr:hypothetical protein HBH82_037170 [Parastagonospora nodorum]KAH4693637.1 hypothetical protein HBH78_073150 [Parastagonospora nodorum]KAH4700562.1 hypothetical protein HBH67_143850 [Parastagonospora nodorum]KAH4789777.1 hypothetical protein HBH62_044340 [Parastagonospora nodorum]KAH4791779.1 hypothetical protein HBH63_100100 [Parastagonospora nodorum]